MLNSQAWGTLDSEGAYLPFLEAFRPAAQPTPATVTQMSLSLSAHGGIPGVYANQATDTFEILTVHLVPDSKPPRTRYFVGQQYFRIRRHHTVTPPGLINLVQLPTNAFYLANPAVLCPNTAVTLDNHWAGVACVGPFDAGDADETAVQPDAACRYLTRTCTLCMTAFSPCGKRGSRLAC